MTRLLLRSAALIGGVTFACCSYNLVAQDTLPPPAAVKLPVTRITLTTAGIGYFHREGTVDGTGRVELRVAEDEVNDLILTLLAEDAKGTGKQITYETRAPAEVTLKAFRIDLTENPSVGTLLGQVRGERVTILFEGKGDAVSSVTGSIISVQTPQEKLSGDGVTIVPPRKDEVEQVNLFTEDGLQSVPLAKLRSVKFLKAELQAEFRQALSALASARGDGKKSIGVTFQGQGLRPVSIGYVSEAPLWKPTYRLTLPPHGGVLGFNGIGNNLGNGGGVAGIGGGSISPSAGQITPQQPIGPAGGIGGIGGNFGFGGMPMNTARLQSFAAVENTTDEDWKNVRMKLVSSRPITFRMDLYDPLYVPRPTVEPELYASLRPPLYQAPATMLGGGFGNLGNNLGMQGGQFNVTQIPSQNNNLTLNSANPLGNQAQGAGILGGNGVAANLGSGGGVIGVSGGQIGQMGLAANRGYLRSKLTYDELRERQAERSKAPVTDPVAAAATNLGESFEYTIAEPVNLARFQSALLPVMNESIESTRLSIYNPAILASYPLKGVRLKNTSKLFLAQGPVTIYDDGVAVGQARLPDVKPGETQLVSYAVDLDLAMKQEDAQQVNTPLSWKIAVCKLVHVMKQRITHTTAVVNRGGEVKRLWITHPRQPQWKLLAPEKPAETTANLYRFEITVPANATAKLEVIEEREDTASTNLEGLSASKIDDLLAEAKIPAAVRTALLSVKANDEAQFRTVSAMNAANIAIKEITEEQTRQRANLTALPPESDAYKRLVKKFDDQETALETHRAKLKELEETKAKQSKELKALVKDLKAE